MLWSTGLANPNIAAIAAINSFELDESFVISCPFFLMIQKRATAQNRPLHRWRRLNAMPAAVAQTLAAARQSHHFAHTSGR